MDRFLKYTTGSEPVITINVVAAIGFGIVVTVLGRMGITLDETEMTLLGAAFFVGATWLARRGVFSPETHEKEVTEALYTPPPIDA
jgi:hypothetical protein